MTAKIFNFRNNKVRLATAGSYFTLYGVTTYNAGTPNTTLPLGVSPSEVSAVVLTIQCSNITGGSGLPSVQTVNVSARITNNTVSRMLVSDYPVIAHNSFDPLNGNLILTSDDVIEIECSVANGIDVTISLLEIANATAT